MGTLKCRKPKIEFCGWFSATHSGRNVVSFGFQSHVSDRMTLQEKLFSATADAISVYMKLYDGAALSGSPVTKTGDGYASFIDCAKTNNRLVVTTMNSHPGEFAIGIGQKGSDHPSFDVLTEDQLSTATFVKYMEGHFAK